MTATYREAKGRDIDTPTLERFNHGDFDFRQVEEGGGKVLVTTDATPLLKAHSKGKLTDKQRDAGLWFEFAYGLVWGSEVGGRRDPLDMTPRGAPANSNATAMYLHYKDVLEKVEARLKLETKAEYAERRKKYPLASVSQYKRVGKWGEQRYRIIRAVCYEGASLGKIERTRRRYQLLCEGLDIIHDVVL